MSPRPRSFRSRFAVGIGAIALAATPALAAPAAVAGEPGSPAGQHGARQTFPDCIELPDNFQPEGITIGPRNQAYLGSRLDGDILRADLRTGRTTTISQGPGTASVGLKIDQRGRLFVAGGPSGTLRVVDSRSGALLRTYQLATGESFVNDVLISGESAFEELPDVMQALASGEAGEFGADFMRAKITTARFYADHLLTKAPGIRDSIVEGADSVTALAVDAF